MAWPNKRASKESKMTKQIMKALAAVMMMAMLFAIPGCQKKEVTSASDSGTAGSGGIGSGAGRGKGVGEQDLGGAAGRAGGAGGAGGASSISASERMAFENEDILFMYDSSALTSQAQDVLRKKAAFMKTNGSVKVTIEGHCDERGTNEYNLALGEARARAAKAFLVDLGIPTARLATISYGEERPIAKGHTEEDYAKNRRCHFVVEQ
jgi:peptidoglycan-associated lipoprotein